MEVGGILWFENLTMADPFYLLPILTSASIYLQVHTYIYIHEDRHDRRETLCLV